MVGKHGALRRSADLWALYSPTAKNANMLPKVDVEPLNRLHGTNALCTTLACAVAQAGPRAYGLGEDGQLRDTLRARQGLRAFSLVSCDASVIGPGVTNCGKAHQSLRQTRAVD